MSVGELLQFAGDMTTTGLLLLVLWQGLQRFDRLLDLVIILAARANLPADEINDLRREVLGNGNSKDRPKL